MISRPKQSPRVVSSLRADLVGVGLLAFLAVAFWQLDILSATSPIPAFPGFDLFSEFLPRHHYAGAALRSGRVPLWDPTQAAGLPFVATWQAGFFYPPNLLYAVLPTGLAMGVLARLHLFLCGLFAWMLARELELTRPAALLAAVTFMLGGATVFLIYHTCAINAAPWLPAALLCAWRLGRRPGVAGAVALAVVLALQFLAGRDFIVVMTLDAVALLTLFQWTARLLRGEGLAGLAPHLGFLIVAGLLTVGLVAVQALPTLELASRSGRTLEGLPPGMLEPFGSMPPRLFLANLVHPVRGPIRREYFGWIPLVFALVALLQIRRRPAVAFFATLSTISLLLTFGLQTPAYAVYAALPLGNVFRLPDRFVFLFSFGVAFLAAFGLDGLFAQRRESARARAAAVVLVATFCTIIAATVATKWLRDGVRAAAAPWGWFWYYELDLEHFGGLGPAAIAAALALLLVAAASAAAGRSRAGGLKFLLVALAAFDLVHASRSVSPHPEHSVAQATSAADCYRRVEPLLAEQGRHLSLRISGSYALKDKDGELFGTHSATHYDPLITRRHAVFFGLLQENGQAVVDSPWNQTAAFMGMLSHGPRPERLKLLDLLGVRALLVDARPSRRPATFESVVSHFEPYDACVVDAGGEAVPVSLLANPRAMPRASVLFDAEAVTGMEQAAEALARDDFDPAHSVVVEAPELPPLQAPDAKARVTIVEQADDRVVVDVTSAARGVLLLTDAYDPEWTATVNGRDVEIHPADVLFRAIVVEAGDSTVVFEYQPVLFQAGAVVTASSLLVAAALLAIARRRENLPSQDETRQGGSA